MSKMNEAVKELKVLTVSKCTEDGAAYMAVLKEKDGERILPERGFPLVDEDEGE